MGGRAGTRRAAGLNPLFGQGMSVAAPQAVELRRCLAAGGRNLARRYFVAAARRIDVAWDLAIGADLSLPQVAGERSVRVRVVNSYVARLQAAAAHDPVLTNRFLRVTSLLDPPTLLLTPPVALRVLRGAHAARATATR